MNTLIAIGVILLCIVCACPMVFLMFVIVVQAVSRIEQHEQKVLDIQAGMRENKRK